MFIGMTGLHGSGKSYFAHNVAEKYGFSVYYKNDVIAEIYKDNEDWIDLYRREYQKDPYNITMNILSRLPLDKDIILDAVHNNDEWEIIKSVIPEAMLILVTAPKEIRINRWKKDCEGDEKRIKYWHKIKKENSVDCLLTKVSWSFNGNSSIENNQRNFEEFLEYAKQKEDNTTTKLERLVQENMMINDKLKRARELLEDYKKMQTVVR